MGSDESYRAWLERRRAVRVPAGFADRAMSAIAGRADGRVPVLAALSAHPVLRVAAVLAGALVGFFRVALLVYAAMAA